MIQVGTILKVSDNSGAKIVFCIKVLGGSKKKFAKVGDLIKVSVRDSVSSKIEKGKVYNAIVVNTRYKIHRNDGFSFNFDKNSVVMIDEKKEIMLGTRILNTLPRELSNFSNKYKFIRKILSLAPEII